MSDKLYNVLKWVAIIMLPALSTFYFVVGGIWGWPYGEQVVGTMAAISTLLGALLGVSTAQYNNKLQTPKITKAKK